MSKMCGYSMLLGFLVLFLGMGCSTTPAPVLDAGRMQMQASRTIEANVRDIVTAYTTEVKAMSKERYVAEFKQAEDVLKAQSQVPGTVNLEQYKQVAAAFATEVARSDAYYEEKAKQLLEKLAYQFAVSQSLSNAVQAYNEATGIPPETFDNLVNGIMDLVEDVAAAVPEIQTNRPSGRQEVDWQALLEIIAARARQAQGE